MNSLEQPIQYALQLIDDFATNKNVSIQSVILRNTCILIVGLPIEPCHIANFNIIVLTDYHLRCS